MCLCNVLLFLEIGSPLTVSAISGIFSCHIFYSQRMVDIRDGKPKWAGMNDSSDLIEE